MSRREFSRKTKAQAFARAEGKCEVCSARLAPGKFRYDHRIPDALGGEPTLENCVVQCVACDAPKTATDVARIRKADRQRDKHNRAYKPSLRPLPCGKRSPFRKKINGQVVPREG
jgi:5-methylcytosine-specific restriction endonuclease McrA